MLRLGLEVDNAARDPRAFELGIDLDVDRAALVLNVTWMGRDASYLMVAGRSGDSRVLVSGIDVQPVVKAKPVARAMPAERCASPADTPKIPDAAKRFFQPLDIDGPFLR